MQGFQAFKIFNFCLFSLIPRFLPIRLLPIAHLPSDFHLSGFCLSRLLPIGHSPIKTLAYHKGSAHLTIPSPVHTLGFIIGHLSKNLWQKQVDKVTLGAFVMKTEGLCWNTDSKLDLVLFFTHFLHSKHFKLDQLCQQPRPTGSRLFGLKCTL